MNAIAIDFETANPSREAATACSLGIAVIENDEVVESKSYIIRPEPLDFQYYNTQVHGITAADVEDAPTFKELWPDISRYFVGSTVLAFNMSFDQMVLEQALDYYHIRRPNCCYSCVLELARESFPFMKSHKLNAVCELLGIPLVHHNATSDAIACAQIYLRILRAAGKLDNPQSLMPDPSKATHKARREYHRPPITKRAKDVIESIPIATECSFFGKRFVFTGAMKSLSREEALEAVRMGGGVPQDNVTQKTDYLVVGTQDERISAGGISGKMKRAYAMQDAGNDIRIISEDDFVSMADELLKVTAATRREEVLM